MGAQSDVSFEAMEVDQDHSHGLVKSEPGISPLARVRRWKPAAPIRLWRAHESDWKRQYWRERTCWSDG